jgi:hypothetical protein
VPREAILLGAQFSARAWICSKYHTYGISNYRHKSAQDVILLILFHNVPKGGFSSA